MTSGQKTIYVEDGRSFLHQLEIALASQNVVPHEICREVIGSRIITRSEVCLADDIIYIDDDPCLGGFLSGPPDVVDRLAKLAFH